MKPGASASKYPTPAPVLRPGFLSILLSAVLAGTTFLVLPFFGLLSAGQHQRIDLTAAPAVVPAPPERAHPKAVPKPRPRRRPKPSRRLREQRPHLERPRQQVEALQAQLSLAMTSLRTDVGDFSLDFQVKPRTAPKAAEEKPSIFQPAQLDKPLRPLMCMKPIYPPQARQRGIEGFVELAFIITPEGKVIDIEVVRSEPGEVFVSVARTAVSRWRFSPPLKEGKPVATRARQVIRFQLEDR